VVLRRRLTKTGANIPDAFPEGPRPPEVPRELLSELGWHPQGGYQWATFYQVGVFNAV